MRCPRCHHNNSRVIDSRQADDGRAIRRRRECENCSYRFTTFERIEAAPLLVIKKMGIVKNLIVIKFCVGSFALRKKDPLLWNKWFKLSIMLKIECVV